MRHRLACRGLGRWLRLQPQVLEDLLDHRLPEDGRDDPELPAAAVRAVLHDIIPSYMGNSVAHWEGDTLVVDIVGFNDKTWLAGTSTFHTEALHVVERYTRVSRDRIDYEVTIEDPNVLTKPWRLTSSLMLREGTRLHEYVCAENNLDPNRYERLLSEGVDLTRD